MWSCVRVCACVCIRMCACVCAHVHLCSRKDRAKAVCVICLNPAFPLEKEPRLCVLLPQGVGQQSVKGAMALQNPCPVVRLCAQPEATSCHAMSVATKSPIPILA